MLSKMLRGWLFRLEARKLAALVVAVRSRIEAQEVRLTADLLVLLDLRHGRLIVRAALRGALVAESSFRVRHGSLSVNRGRAGKAYFFSRCNVCLRRLGLYFINSNRSVVFRLFLVVV